MLLGRIQSRNVRHDTKNIAGVKNLLIVAALVFSGSFRKPFGEAVRYAITLEVFMSFPKSWDGAFPQSGMPPLRGIHTPVAFR